MVIVLPDLVMWETGRYYLAPC